MMVFTDAQLREFNPLMILRQLGGYYKCPKNPDGQRLGPLVGYAGRYKAPDGTMKQYVGDEYANFALAEVWPYILDAWAARMAEKLDPFSTIVTGIGMPIGGYSWNDALCRRMGWRAIKAEKQVIRLKTETDREQSKLVMARHQINMRGEQVALVEDVVNNFATTGEAYELVKSNGGIVVAIVCMLNRSGKSAWVAEDGTEVPIVALVTRQIDEYKQEDPAVIEDVARGQLVTKPKDSWSWLEKHMAAADRAEEGG